MKQSQRAGERYLQQETYLLSAHSWRQPDKSCSFHRKPDRTIVVLEQDLSVAVGLLLEPEDLS